MRDRDRIRVWDKKKKRYYEIFINNVITTVFGKGAIVEHCVGKTDKNGILIHGGDILLAENFGQQERWWGVVKWQINGFVISYHKPNNKTWTELTCIADGDCSHWEIIGNIHENPELLNKGDNQ